MKKTLLVILIAASSAQALTINWEEDSPTNFAVSISGIGLSWQGTTVSPSGLWSLWTYQNAFFLPEEKVYITHSGVMTYLGTDEHYQLRTLPYSHFYVASAPIRESVPWIYNDGPFGFTLPYEQDYGWYGDQNPIAITSIPDLCDSSTWSWTTHWSASGTQVPEGGSMVLGLLTLLILPVFRHCLAVQ